MITVATAFNYLSPFSQLDSRGGIMCTIANVMHSIESLRFMFGRGHANACSYLLKSSFTVIFNFK